jgi:hypothetical protein
MAFGQLAEKALSLKQQKKGLMLLLVVVFMKGY